MPSIRRHELIKHLDNFHKRVTEGDKELDKYLKDRLQETLDFFTESLNNVEQSLSEPLLTKNVKPGPKKRGPKISAIPENKVVDEYDKCDDSTIDESKTKKGSRASKRTMTGTHAVNAVETEETENNFNGRRTTRTASKRAMEQMQIFAESPKVKKSRLTKKTQLDKEDNKEIELPPKISKISRTNSSVARNLTIDLESSLNQQDEPDKNATTVISSKAEEKPSRKRANETTSIKLSTGEQRQNEEPPLKKMNTEKCETTICSTETTFYEDAIEKHNILSSTMNASALMKHKKLLNPAVMLEPLAPITNAANDETFVVPTKISKTHNTSAKVSEISDKGEEKKKSSDVANKPKDQMKTKERNNSWLESSADMSLITDDESDVVVGKNTKKPRLLRSSLLSDDDMVESTPPVATQANNKVKAAMPAKNTYKNGALFSPYLKESVKKRVEAFEQVAASPQKEAATAATTVTRVTRTKTRAMANQNNQAEEQKAKSKEDTEDEEAVMKENVKKKMTEKAPAKSVKKSQQQLKYNTPIGKNRIPVATSTSKAYTPISHPNYNTYTKPLTASKINNLVTNVESFIPKSASKLSSIDKSEEKYHRKTSTDDVKLKRDIQLKAMVEAKKQKRELKEQKIREAREAKNKLEMEKRLKAEKEKEEKAKLALLAQEKAREEAEKKRIANMLEKKKLAEMRALQQAQAAQEQTKQKMAKKQTQKPPQNAYKLESEPESDDDDFETKPKFPIPEWAKPTSRGDLLAAQSMIPKSLILKLFNTKRCTPDLSELFKGINKNRVVRTSSAIWKSPPRFSRMVHDD